jgi:tRNA threonylcarbamoyladenosine modification (KEOPS) complex Cgi121 subunit
MKMIKSMKMCWMVHVACMGRRQIHRAIWWVKAEGERPLRRHKYRLEDNIKMNLREIVLGLTQAKNKCDALMNCQICRI